MVERSPRTKKNLKKLPTYVIRPQDIPKSPDYLIIGKGFDWLPKHTQRLYDANSTEGKELLEDSMWYMYGRRIQQWASTTKRAYFLAKLLNKQSILNPWKPLPPVGGSTLVHGIELDETTIVLDQDERNGHTGVYGTTRVGKTRVCEYYIAQDCSKKNNVVVCVDPKGDQGLFKRCFIEAKRNNRNFYFIHLGFPDVSCRYNAIGSFSRISEVATRATSGISGEGSSAAFKEFCWRFANIISQARVRLGERPSYEQLAQDIVDIEPLYQRYFLWFMRNKYPSTDWEKELRILEKSKEFKPSKVMMGKQRRSAAIDNIITKRKIFDPVLAGLLSCVRYDKTYFDKIVASLLPQLERLTSGRLSELISPDYSDLDDNRPIIDWMTIIRQNAVVYVGLDAMTDIATSSTFANAFFADLLSTSGFLYKHGYELGLYGGNKGLLPTIDMHNDEFNEYCGCFGPLLNKAGGSGIRTTNYTQVRSDLVVGTQSPDKAAVLEGNMNTLIMMRVKGKQTAELLTDQIAKCQINQFTTVSGANDSSDVNNSIHFTSKNEDRRTSVETELISVENIMQQPKGQAFILQKGSKLSHVRFPLINDNADNIKLPSYLEDMCEEMATKYNTGNEWWKYAPGAEHNELKPITNDEQEAMIGLSACMNLVYKELGVSTEEQIAEVAE
ncbi:type IV conjugative transfer system coupling protein TraD [Photobacterium kishitanii]|uniref:type IV conjugative transfer system coupling protein TraD n=1 Tax=Photobacterium kishitanii TaxID=318456 RepID=UPI00069B1AE4|nr:type IV conjugative transfer system coupling protein TraD [Photobacterium kishitanii]